MRCGAVRCAWTVETSRMCCGLLLLLLLLLLAASFASSQRPLIGPPCRPSPVARFYCPFVCVYVYVYDCATEY
jgi:hypothetical protein